MNTMSRLSTCSHIPWFKCSGVEAGSGVLQTESGVRDALASPIQEQSQLPRDGQLNWHNAWWYTDETPGIVIGNICAYYWRQQLIYMVKHDNTSGIIFCVRPANERWRYIVTSSLIGWEHTQNDHYTHDKYLLLIWQEMQLAYHLFSP